MLVPTRKIDWFWSWYPGLECTMDLSLIIRNPNGSSSLNTNQRSFSSDQVGLLLGINLSGFPRNLVIIAPKQATTQLRLCGIFIHKFHLNLWPQLELRDMEKEMLPEN